MYYGEFSSAIDGKGRIMVPAAFRTVMEALDHDTWYMTRGFDASIFVFHKAKWEELVVKQGERYSVLDPRLLDFRRLFLGSVAKVKRDSQGRLGIPSHLREYAGLDGEAVLLGVEDHLELWNKERWRAFQERQAEEYKAMAAELFGPRGGSSAATTEGGAQGNEH